MKVLEQKKLQVGGGGAKSSLFRVKEVNHEMQKTWNYNAYNNLPPWSKVFFDTCFKKN